MRPQAREAQDGLTQAEQGIRLDQIALVEARALAFERRELWDQAIAQYRGALEGDPNLVFAKEGLERSEVDPLRPALRAGPADSPANRQSVSAPRSSWPRLLNSTSARGACRRAAAAASVPR